MRLPWKRDNAVLRARLTPEQYRVTQKAGTERPYSGRYHDTNDDGTYRCIVCDTALFDSDTKFDSGTGWPSFTDAIDTTSVSLHKDRKFGILRTEVRCAGCDAHLGHVFPDGPSPSGDRFCMNSASLQLGDGRHAGVTFRKHVLHAAARSCQDDHAPPLMLRRRTGPSEPHRPSRRIRRPATSGTAVLRPRGRTEASSIDD